MWYQWKRIGFRWSTSVERRKLKRVLNAIKTDTSSLEKPITHEGSSNIMQVSALPKKGNGNIGSKAKVIARIG